MFSKRRENHGTLKVKLNMKKINTKMTPYKIMIVNAPNESSKQNACFPNIGIVQLATRVKQDYGRNIDVKILDGGILNRKKIEKFMIEYGPDLVGVSVLTPTYKEGLNIAREANDLGAKIVFGGDHAGFFPELILKNRKFIDYIITNDLGETPFSELVYALKEKKELKEIDSLVYRKGTKIIKNPTQKFSLKKQNTRPDLNLIDLNSYWNNYNATFGHLHTSEVKSITINYARGCENGKNRCTYCSIADLRINTGNPKEFWKTVNWYNKKHGINMFFEVCDSITADPKYLENLIETMPRNLLEKINDNSLEFMVYARSLGLLKRNNIAKLKELGIKIVNIGLDSGDKEMLKLHRKNKTTVQTNLEALEGLNKHGIQVHGSYILGGLGETKENLENTIQHIDGILSRVKFSSMEFDKFVPLPNSPAWDIMVNYNNPNFYKSKFDIEEVLRNAKINIPNKKHEELRRKYIDKDDLDINDLVKDWFENFTHLDENDAINRINEVKYLAVDKLLTFS